ncbi:MAG TPA: hypothetical protein PKA64_27020, partial [Myxococcota bacterium]|nr:hypothetical protein [Myxococcota bacterium]
VVATSSGAAGAATPHLVIHPADLPDDLAGVGRLREEFPELRARLREDPSGALCEAWIDRVLDAIMSSERPVVVLLDELDGVVDDLLREPVDAGGGRRPSALGRWFVRLAEESRVAAGWVKVVAPLTYDRLVALHEARGRRPEVDALDLLLRWPVPLRAWDEAELDAWLERDPRGIVGADAAAIAEGVRGRLLLLPPLIEDVALALRRGEWRPSVEAGDLALSTRLDDAMRPGATAGLGRPVNLAREHLRRCMGCADEAAWAALLGSARSGGRSDACNMLRDLGWAANVQMCGPAGLGIAPDPSRREPVLIVWGSGSRASLARSGGVDEGAWGALAFVEAGRGAVTWAEARDVVGLSPRDLRVLLAVVWAGSDGVRSSDLASRAAAVDGLPELTADLEGLPPSASLDGRAVHHLAEVKLAGTAFASLIERPGRGRRDGVYRAWPVHVARVDPSTRELAWVR